MAAGQPAVSRGPSKETTGSGGGELAATSKRGSSKEGSAVPLRGRSGPLGAAATAAVADLRGSPSAGALVRSPSAGGLGSGGGANALGDVHGSSVVRRRLAMAPTSHAAVCAKVQANRAAEPERAGASAFAKRRSTIAGVVTASSTSSAAVAESGFNSTTARFLRRTSTIGDGETIRARLAAMGASSHEADEFARKAAAEKAEAPNPWLQMRASQERDTSKDASEKKEVKAEGLTGEKLAAYHSEKAEEYRKEKLRAKEEAGLKEKNELKEYLRIKELLRESRETGTMKENWDAVHERFKDKQAFEKIKIVHTCLGKPKLLEAMDALVKVVKKNSDGLKRVFEEMDLDGNGTLSKSELRQGLREMGVALSPIEIIQIMNIFDEDHNDAIDFSEFATLLDKHEALRLLNSAPDEEAVDLLMGFSVGDTVKSLVMTGSHDNDKDLYEIGNIVGPGSTQNTVKVKLQSGKLVSLKPRQFELVKSVKESPRKRCATRRATIGDAAEVRYSRP
eukprot:TRINITY_DN25018_c0_g1_i1.p1 TRINITY_DN25018_c0_g1~~TRINITY_DN25018_c0_g1_i1.p1  ORF type:complete len:508 (+),score=129.33 TRINITY_DN25018_c0_g1_i1:154-1677(+)